MEPYFRCRPNTRPHLCRNELEGQQRGDLVAAGRGRPRAQLAAVDGHPLAHDRQPALVLGAQILFGALLGLMGLFLADPIVAMIKVALEREAERNAGAAQTKTAAGT